MVKNSFSGFQRLLYFGPRMWKIVPSETKQAEPI